MRVIIPFKPVNPKSRLSNVLSLKEREDLVRYMLLDVIDAVYNFSDEIIILTPCDFTPECDVKVVVDDRNLSEAVNSLIRDNTAVIMSDLPLLNEDVLKRFFGCRSEVVIAPGRRGGTNMLLIRNGRFRVSYYYGSFFKHIEIAKRLGLSFEIFDSFYASVDIDEESDLLELLMHGRGKRSYGYLTSIGFKVLFEREPRLIRSNSKKM